MGNTVGSQLREIVIGTLLGDGYFEQNGRYKRLVCGHSLKQHEYITWKFNLLNQLTQCRLNYKTWQDPRNKRVYCSVQLRSITSPIWNEFYDIFYKNGRRIIPHNLPDIISAQILAIWIMDDGYRRNDCNAMRLNTQAYSYNEHQLIKRSLEKLGIKSTIHRQASYFVTYIPSSSMDVLRSKVRPYIVPSMEYKLA
jgi:LAGLIDADG DNA endonuclease family protein